MTPIELMIVFAAAWAWAGLGIYLLIARRRGLPQLRMAHQLGLLVITVALWPSMLELLRDRRRSLDSRSPSRLL